MKYLQFIAGILPGAGHVHHGALSRGLVLLLTFALFLNTSIMSPFWFPDTFPYQIRIVSGVLATFVWLYSYIDLIFLNLRMHQRNDRETETDDEDA